MRRYLKHIAASLADAAVTPRRRYLQQAALQAERDRVLSAIAERMPENPVLQGYKVYAQSDEDGILAEIFRRIGTTSRVAFEFGCGDGRENNTHALLLGGWRALWVDGDDGNVARIRAALRQGTPADLLLCQAYVTLGNVETIADAAAARLLGAGERIDLLSMDLDGNDLDFLKRLVRLRPRVVCAEYNAALGPEIDAAVAYRADHVWAGDDYMGASLAALVEALGAEGYALVCCNLSGANAFFVEKGEAHRFGGYDPRRLFQPPRYHFVFLDDFHPPSLKFLADRCRYDMLEVRS